MVLIDRHGANLSKYTLIGPSCGYLSPSPLAYPRTSLLLSPTLDLIECQHISIVIHPLQQIQRVPDAGTDVITRPNNEPCPVSLVCLELSRLHNTSNLRGGDDLGIAGERKEVVVSSTDRAVVVLRVGVGGNDVDIGVTWVPICGHGIPDPDQILQFVDAS